MIEKDFDDQLSMLEHMTNTFENGLDELEERGLMGGSAYYKAMQEIERQNIEIMKKEVADLSAALDEAVNSGAIQEYSQSWYSMKQSINDVNEAIQEANISILEYQNSLRELEWDRFDYLEDRISKITEESDFLIDLMSNDDLYDEQGHFNDLGRATAGLHGMNYNTYMAQADQYAKEIENIDKELANDPYNTKLIERREELLGLQQDSILAAEDEKQAIVDLVSDGIDLELEALQDLIDKYKDSLSSAKDLFDYQRKISDQTSDIAKLQKQLAAYEGDNSEENRARVQEIRNNLKEAEDELRETEYDQYISDTEDLLDDLMEEYEELLNQRLDDVDSLMNEMIGSINSSASEIMDTLVSESSAVGYELSETMKTIWAGGGELGEVITTYGDNFLSSMTSLNDVLGRIEAYVAAMVNAGDTTAENTVNPPSPSTSAETTPETETSDTSGDQTTTETPTEEAAATDKKKVKITKGQWYVRTGPSTSKKKLGIVKKGKTLEYRGEKKGSWYAVVYKGKDAWVSSKGSKLVGYSAGGYVADMQRVAMRNGDDMVTVNTLKKGEAILTPEQAQQFSGLVNDLPKLQGIVDMSKYLSDISGRPVGSGVSIGNVSFNIPIDHVENYDDFVAQIQKDDKFERLIQSMTVDRIAGNSKLSKYRVRL